MQQMTNRLHGILELPKDSSGYDNDTIDQLPDEEYVFSTDLSMHDDQHNIKANRHQQNVTSTTRKRATSSHHVQSIISKNIDSNSVDVVDYNGGNDAEPASKKQQTKGERLTLSTKRTEQQPFSCMKLRSMVTNDTIDLTTPEDETAIVLQTVEDEMVSDAKQTDVDVVKKKRALSRERKMTQSSGMDQLGVRTKPKFLAGRRLIGESNRDSEQKTVSVLFFFI